VQTDSIVGQDVVAQAEHEDFGRRGNWGVRDLGSEGVREASSDRLSLIGY
jgi:hypothetical protein